MHRRVNIIWRREVEIKCELSTIKIKIGFSIILQCLKIIAQNVIRSLFTASKAYITQSKRQ